MNYELHLEKYEGPLEKLLELVEEQKLEITEISLAAVTDDFLKYVKKLEKVEAPLLADFIVVASRLILIKSKSLLPELELTPEEEGDIKDLERRLALYRELRPAMRALSRLARTKRAEYGRQYFLNLGTGAAKLVSGENFFYPGEGLSKEAMADSLRKLFEIVQTFALETATIKDRIITVEEKIKEIVNRLIEQSELSFKSFSKVKPVSEIVAFFLAILHLAHEQRIFLEQQEAFSDIIIKKQESNK